MTVRCIPLERASEPPSFSGRLTARSGGDGRDGMAAVDSEAVAVERASSEDETERLNDRPTDDLNLAVGRGGIHCGGLLSIRVGETYKP